MQYVLVVIHLKVKWQEREAGHPPPASAAPLLTHMTSWGMTFAQIYQNSAMKTIPVPKSNLYEILT
jgi:hypothetical protein